MVEKLRANTYISDIKKEIDMAGKVYLSESDTYMLWGRAAGRCEFDGCNKISHRDCLDLQTLNLAERAHIIARSPKGPRGSVKKSKTFVDNIDNVMLLVLNQ